MDFTREPIVETVISAKEGHKLLVRSSKISGAEEYNVDAVEVVSFGSVQFFRAQEKPRPFLVPVTDYEVLEVREMRLPIKSANHERAIKIAPKKEGGKKSKAKEKTEERAEERAEEGEAKKKRTRRRTRRKKGEDSEAPETDEAVEPSEERAEETPPPRKPLVPPPTTLISETISRYKDILMGEDEGKVKPPELPKELLQEEVKDEAQEEAKSE